MPDNERRQKPGAAKKPRRVADQPVADAGALDAGIRSPTTETGLSVEEQIRKEWDPKKQGGLPTSVRLGVGQASAR